MVEHIIREIPAREAPSMMSRQDSERKWWRLMVEYGANFEICSARASYSILIRLQMVASHLNVPTL